MSFTRRVFSGHQDLNGGEKLEASEDIVGSRSIDLSETIPGSSTDYLVLYTIDVSALKYIWIKANAVMTLEFNSSSAPSKSIQLAAGSAFVWSLTSGEANPFVSTDVTALYVTSTAGGQLDIRGLVDATP